MNTNNHRKTPKLPLTVKERTALRKNKIKLSQIAGNQPDELAEKLEIDKKRAKRLIALALFQTIPSVGPKLAVNIVDDLGYYSFEEIKNYKGEELTHQLEKKHGVWMDPCVEDVMRCVVYHANHPGSSKNWWDFTEERKAYRETFGYPEDRPTKAWHQ